MGSMQHVQQCCGSPVIALSHEIMHAPVAASPANGPLLLLLLSWWSQGVVRAGMLTLPSREHFMVSIGKMLPVYHTSSRPVHAVLTAHIRQAGASSKLVCPVCVSARCTTAWA